MFASHATFSISTLQVTEHNLSMVHAFFPFTHAGCIPGNSPAVPTADLAQAVPLGNALLLFLCVPWTLCALFYTGLHITYPRDKRSAALAELERCGGGGGGLGAAATPVPVAGRQEQHAAPAAAVPRS